MAEIPLKARRVFRLALTTALALGFAYALALPLPFIAPLFAFMLMASPGVPMGPRGLLGLIVVVLITLGMGLLLIPMLTWYPLSALLIVLVGLYFSNYLTVNMGKGLVGALLTVGFTLISAAGTLSFALAITVIQALVAGIALAIACQWLIYPWFPEEPIAGSRKQPAVVDAERTNWIALRATLIIFPVFVLTLTNPPAYLPIIMKSVSLGQQSSMINVRNAGRELLGSTFLAGCFSVLFWLLLKIHPNLWMFFLWMLLFGLYFSSKLYGVIATRYPPSFWINVTVTLLILLGSAVSDSATGKDVYQGFAVRMGLFIAVTLYAWLAIEFLEYLKGRRLVRKPPLKLQAGTP